jgi:hypothetical protein
MSSKAFQNADKLNEIVSVVDFGAVGNGVSDDTAAFQAAIDFVAAKKGGTVTFNGRYLIDGNLIIKDYVTLQGPLGMPDEILPATSADYDGQSGVLILNSIATISTNDGASICNCLIIRKGLDLPFANAAAATSGIAAFAGTAITVAGAGSYFHHLLILGFNLAILSQNFERVRCEYVQGDCTNGIHLFTVYDIAYVENCHFWPWTTTHNSWTTGALLKRSGTAYKYSSAGDWSKLTNCFSYGYETGFSIDSCDNVNLIGCGADHFGNDINTSSIGFNVTGTSKNILLLGCQAAAQATGVVINTSADSAFPFNSHRIQSCNFWDNDSSAISVLLGRANISGCDIRSKSTIAGSNGIIVQSSDGVTAIGNDFSNIPATTVVISGLALRTSTFYANRFNNCTDTVGEILAVDTTDQNFLSTTVARPNGNGFSYNVRVSRGTLAVPTISQNNDTTVAINGYLWDGSDYRRAGEIRLQAQGAPSAGSSSGSWIVSTTPSGSTSPVDKIAVYGNGNVSPITDNAYSNGINGLRWSAIWAANGTIQTSDAREKTDVADASLGLSFINALRPVSYKWIEGSKEVVRQVFRDTQGNECEPTASDAVPSEIITKSIPGQRTHWGLLAQEVKAACDSAGVDFGGWVLTEKDNQDSQQALRYDQFIAPLIKAVQELSKKVADLEAK